jgi:tetratricopeptide (TPR) repeat protein
MYITTNATNNAGLTTLLEATLGSLASNGTGSSSAAGFGPAALLSLGSSSASASAGVYTQLAGLAAQLRTPATPVYSTKQTEAEQATIKQATALRVNGNYDDARALLQGVLKKNPTNGVAVHGLGAIELDQGNFEKAEAYFTQAHYYAPSYGFDRDATNARILQKDDAYVLDQARKLTNNSDTLGDGVRLLVSLTRRSPANADARALLGEKLIEQGNAQQGLAQYQIAISIADEAQTRRIEAKLESLVKIAPEAAYLQNLLGQTQLKLGKNEQAAETLALASQLSDNNELFVADEAKAHLALGYDAMDGGDLVHALTEFTAAQKLDPYGNDVNKGLADVYLARGQQKARMGDPTRAIAEYEQAKIHVLALDKPKPDADQSADETDDPNAELRANLASAFYDAGRTLERRRIAAGDEVGKELNGFQSAYDLDTENLTYQRKLAVTQSTVGDQYLADGKLQQAANAYEAAYQVYSTDTSYRDAAISAFMAWGDERTAGYDHGQAIAAYQAAYDLDKDNATSKTSLADAFNRRGLFYRSLGRDFFGDAANDFQSALDLYPDNQGYKDNYDSVIY